MVPNSFTCTTTHTRKEQFNFPSTKMNPRSQEKKVIDPNLSLWDSIQPMLLS